MLATLRPKGADKMLIVSILLQSALVLALPHATSKLRGRSPLPGFTANDNTSTSATGYNGAVACEVKECSQIGVDILSQGGSAADGIIATTFCVGVIAAYHSGIGGGGFMIVRNGSDKTYEMIDFRETMPAAGNETMYSANSNPNASTIGGLSVGVPGELRGWEMLHRRHGKLPWPDLFKPAIKLARYGFKVTTDLATNLEQPEASFMLNSSLWSEVYAPNGTLLKEGDTVYRKRYADTLEKISWYGPDYFYKGELANNSANAAQEAGGILTTQDLANYTAILRQPTNITYRNQRIFSTVAPSSGNVVLSALKIFEGFPYEDLTTNPQLSLHRLIEADQFAYGQRETYGDPAFTANVTYLQREYLTTNVTETLRGRINDNKTFPLDYYDPEKYAIPRESGTSHVAVIDKDGSAVSLTTTVNLLWGSRVMTVDGIILNDEMDDFSSPGAVNSFGFAASPINYIAPGKRPQSSIASSIAENLETGEVTIATGAAGGSRIITATLQALHHYIDYGYTAPEVEYAPRWHDQLSGVTYFETPNPHYGLEGWSNSTVDYMRGLGYNITLESLDASSGHCVIRNEDGSITAAGDPRSQSSGGAAY